jgi:hypothetical protein
VTSPEVAGSWRLTSVAVSPAGDRLEVPDGWVVQPGPPAVVAPSTWVGTPPAIVVSVEHDEMCGDALVGAVARAAADRLVDAVIVSLEVTGDAGRGPHVDEAGCGPHVEHAGSGPHVDEAGCGPHVEHAGQCPDVEIVVAHRHRGVDVTTVERHHRRGGVRWVVAFTAAHADVPALLPLARRVVASLTIGP